MKIPNPLLSEEPADEDQGSLPYGNAVMIEESLISLYILLSQWGINGVVTAEMG